MELNGTEGALRERTFLMTYFVQKSIGSSFKTMFSEVLLIMYL